jgi:hypothetical protein
VRSTEVKSKNVAGKVECSNLASSITQQLAAADRPDNHFVHMFGGLTFAEDLCLFGEIVAGQCTDIEVIAPNWLT